jgi:hypothetical protein
LRLGRSGGRKPKAISGEQGACLLKRMKASDLALRGFGAGAELSGRGFKVDHRTVCNFVHNEMRVSRDREQGFQRIVSNDFRGS